MSAVTLRELIIDELRAVQPDAEGRAYVPPEGQGWVVPAGVEFAHNKAMAEAYANAITFELGSSFVWQRPVISRWNAAGGLPSSPSVGDRYLATSSGNGWTAGYIYERAASSWNATAPIAGMLLWVTAESQVYVYTGAAWSTMTDNTQHALGTHTDVAISEPALTHVLAYNPCSSKWHNQQLPHSYLSNIGANDHHAAVTVSGNGISLAGQQISLSIGTGSTQVAAGNHAHSGVYDPVGTAAAAVSAHVSAYDHSKLHDAVTVSGNGIGLSGQQVSLSIGTGSTQVAAGNHNHDYSAVYQPLDSDLTSLAGLNPAAGDAGKVVLANGANAYALGQDLRTSGTPQFAKIGIGRAAVNQLIGASVTITPADASADVNPYSYSATVSTTDIGVKWVYGNIYTVCATGGFSTTGRFQAFYARPYMLNHTGSIGQVAGFVVEPYVWGATCSGTVGTMIGIWAAGGAYGGGATETIGIWKQIHIESPNAGTSRYGIYINNIAGGTTNYSIYSAGGDFHFSGAGRVARLGIGTAPHATAALAINGIPAIGSGTAVTSVLSQAADLSISSRSLSLLLSDMGAAAATHTHGTLSGTTMINTGTTDGSDNLMLSLCGGGTDTGARGAYIQMRGNEYATAGGYLDLATGAGVSAQVRVYVDGTLNVSFAAATTTLQSTLKIETLTASRYLMTDASKQLVSKTAAEVLSGIGAAASGHTHAQLHDAVTVSGNGIGLAGQQVSLSIGTGSTQIAAGNHTHDYSAVYQALDADLTSLAGLNPTAGDAEKAVVVSGANTYKLGQNLGLGGSPYFWRVGVDDQTLSRRLYFATAAYSNSEDRTLTFNVNDVNRTITLSGNPTLADWFDQSVKVAATPQFARLGLGAAAHATALATVSGYENQTTIGANSVCAMKLVNTYVADYNRLCEIQFHVDNTNDNRRYAGISARYDEYNATHGCGGSLILWTKANNVSAAREALTLSQYQAATFSSTAKATELRASSDVGGEANCTSLTNASQTSLSSGTGTVKMLGATNRDCSGWIKIYVGTAARFIPYWSTVSG